MKKFILFFGLVLLLTNALAQNHGMRGGRGQGRPSFEQFMNERISFLVSEMKLNKADSVNFVGVYHQMMKEKGELMMKYRGGRELMHRLYNGETVPDSLYTRFIDNETQLQVEDAQLEKDYVAKFLKVLTPKQLFEYRIAEKKFKNNLMRRPRNEHHQEH